MDLHRYHAGTTTHHTMEDLLVFDSAEAAHDLGRVYLADNPGSSYRVETLPDGRYRLSVEEEPVA